MLQVLAVPQLHHVGALAAAVGGVNVESKRDGSLGMVDRALLDQQRPVVLQVGRHVDLDIAQANFDWLGSMPAMVIAAFVFLPYYWRAGVYTIPEFLGRRYNGAVQVIQAIIWLSFMISMLGVMLWTSAVFLGTVLDWNTSTAIWVTVAVVGVYTVSGGLTAVVMTDVMQMVVMFIGAGALLVLSMWETGGWSGMTKTVTELGAAYRDHFTLLDRKSVV